VKKTPKSLGMRPNLTPFIIASKTYRTRRHIAYRHSRFEVSRISWILWAKSSALMGSCLRTNIEHTQLQLQISKLQASKKLQERDSKRDIVACRHEKVTSNVRRVRYCNGVFGTDSAICCMAMTVQLVHVWRMAHSDILSHLRVFIYRHVYLYGRMYTYRHIYR
jgi:hypothetical protein